MEKTYVLKKLTRSSTSTLALMIASSSENHLRVRHPWMARRGRFFRIYEADQCSFTHFSYSSAGCTINPPFIPECPNPHSSAQGISYRPGLVASNQASISP